MGAPLGVIADVELGSRHLLDKPDHGQVTVVLERHAGCQRHANGRRWRRAIVAPAHSRGLGRDDGDAGFASQTVHILVGTVSVFTADRPVICS